MPLWREAHVEVKSVKKADGFGALLEGEMLKKCTPLWCEALIEVTIYKIHQNTAASEHFWKLKCRKSGRRCGAKEISKSKCGKQISLGAVLEVEMLKK